MRRSAITLVLLLLPGAMTGQAGAGADTSDAVTIRRQIRQRWHEHIVNQLLLSQDQAGKLQETEDKYDGLRQPIQQRQVAIAAELNQQMQPGVAANNDVVTRLLAEREDNKAKLQDLDRQQDHELTAYLTPVQRVRYWRQRELFIAKIRQIRESRGVARPMRPRRFR